MTTQRTPQWGEPGYQAPPRRKLTTKAKTIIALAIVGAGLAITAMVIASISDTGSSAAAGDIDKIRLSATPDAIGTKQGFVQVTNHSKRPADYAIALRIMGATGVNLGTVNAAADNVEAGQTARADFIITDDSADHVEIVRVRRTTA